MSSIGSVLNIAKEALLTHQASISVAGHNIANVDTPGYSRQVLQLNEALATPHRVGFFGNGVVAESITRKYDQFLVQRLMDQSSTMNYLEGQQQSMRIIETTFNEVPGLAVNDLMSQFWDAWQGLSNNPELSASRQTVVQQAQLLGEQFESMAAELTQASIDIGVAIDSSIDDVNALTTQLAKLNVNIASSETSKQQQNDLRDNRDQLLKDLASLVDVSYFETSNGAYTILMGDGHSLVEQGSSWSLDWADNNLLWINTTSTGKQYRTTIDQTDNMNGKIGGLIDLNKNLVEGNPDNYRGRLDALANGLIREVNQIHTQGVGLISFSERLTSAELANNAVLLHTTVDTLSSSDFIPAGTLTINDRSIGRIDSGINSRGLAMEKTYNAAQAINAAEAGVQARLTTLVAGNAVTGLGANETITFSVNGITVTHTAGAGGETAAQTASGVVTKINAAINSYDTAVPQNVPSEMTLEAIIGNGLNGGVTNSIVLRNTNQGDESRIIIAGVDNTIGAAEAKLGLTDGTYVADASHNTGELSLFSDEDPIQIDGGADDTYLGHLGWAGTIRYSNQAVTSDAALSTTQFDLNGRTIIIAVPGGTPVTAAPPAPSVTSIAVDEINKVAAFTGVTAEVGNGTNGGPLNSIVFSSDITNITIENYTVTGTDILNLTEINKLGANSADETSNDGKLSYEKADNMVANSLMGMAYADTLQTDGGSFDMWIYNTDGSLALSQPVNVSLERAYDLGDVADAINISIINSISPTPSAPWVEASVVANQLVLTPDSSHKFAFGGDTSNFLASIGINTIFTGNSASTFGINQTVVSNLSHLAAGQVNEFGEIFTGNNSNSLAISNLQRDETITFTGNRTDTFDGFYNSLIATIGLKGDSINVNLDYNTMVNDQLAELRDSTSGVSLDEEMSNLIRYQHAYSAAAKLISTADELMQTLLNTI
nr:flagellar hook-associated protein FlgK [Desulfobulbaceae bacterium]